MSAAIEGASEWLALAGMVPLLGVLFMLWRTRPRIGEMSVQTTLHRVVMRHVIEAQLLALGVPPDRSIEEARLVFERHIDTPITEAGIAEMHDDIVRTAGTVAS